MSLRIWTFPAAVAVAAVFASLFAGCASEPVSTTSVAPAASPAAPVTAAATPSSAPASAAEPTPAEKRTSAASTLAVERQWLAAWFKGTPVVIAQRPNGAVTVDVPREFCFDAGKDIVKPALSAVLDKVSQSMRRTAVAELHLIAAPGDAGANGAALGLRRATRVYESLRSRGLPEARLAKPTAASGTAVQLRIEPASPA